MVRIDWHCFQAPQPQAAFAVVATIAFASFIASKRTGCSPSAAAARPSKTFAIITREDNYLAASFAITG